MVLRDISTRNKIIRECGSISTLSFDIFDTLLSRSIDPPENIKRFVADYAVRELQLGISPNYFYLLRKEVEREICDSSHVHGGDGECCITDVYKIMCRQMGLSDDYVDRLLACELQVEKTYSIIMPGIRELLGQLASKHTLIAISDTYLPVWILMDLLKHNGLADIFSKVYASCEYGVNKGSGRLFSKVLDEEDLRPDALLHIGDNFLGDYFSPRSLGIKAILLRDRKNLRRKTRLAALGKLERISTPWQNAAFAARLTAIQEETAGSAEDQFYRWGRLVIGPLLSNYAHLLCIELDRSNHDVVYFIAREGYLLKKLYELLSGILFDHALPKPRYLCISRYTAFLASLHGDIGSREISIALSEYRVKPDAALARFGISGCHEIRHLIEKHGLLNSAEPSIDELADMLHDVLEDDAGADLVRERSGMMRAGLKAYLEGEGFLSAKSIALADVGWFGGIQDGLEKVFSDRQDKPLIHGYYLALEGSGLYSSSNKTGLVHDFRNPTPEGASLGFFKLAFEFSCRAPHGTTIGYEELSGGRTIPRFKREGREKVNNTAITALQRGVLDCAQAYAKLMKVENVDPFLLRGALLSNYDKQVSFPDASMAEAFSTVINTEDFGSDKIKRIAGSFNLSDILRPRQGLAKIIETPWREAALRQLPLPGFLSIFYIVKRFLAWRNIWRGVILCKGDNDSGTISRLLMIFYARWKLLWTQRYPTLIIYGLTVSSAELGTWLTSILINLLKLLPASFAVSIIMLLIRIKRVLKAEGSNQDKAL